VNTVTASFNTTMGKMTEMCQRKKTAWWYLDAQVTMATILKTMYLF